MQININKRIKKHETGITSLIIIGSLLIENPETSIVSANSATIYKPVKKRLKMRKTNK